MKAVDYSVNNPFLTLRDPSRGGSRSHGVLLGTTKPTQLVSEQKEQNSPRRHEGLEPAVDNIHCCSTNDYTTLPALLHTHARTLPTFPAPLHTCVALPHPHTHRLQAQHGRCVSYQRSHTPHRCTTHTHARKRAHAPPPSTPQLPPSHHTPSTHLHTPAHTHAHAHTHSNIEQKSRVLRDSNHRRSSGM
jgi:hypothetical protein